jgi:hypothetical protein
MEAEGNCITLLSLYLFFSGTTWTQEMAWVIKQDFDFEGAKVPLPERFPFLE